MKGGPARTSGDERGRASAAPARLGSSLLVWARPFVLLLASCRLFDGDPSRIVALEIVGPTSYAAQVGDTLRLKARARAANGDTVGTAVIEWAVLDTGTVGIALDPSTGVVVATSPGTWRVQARVEEIRSDAIVIKVAAKSADD